MNLNVRVFSNMMGISNRYVIFDEDKGEALKGYDVKVYAQKNEAEKALERIRKLTS